MTTLNENPKVAYHLIFSLIRTSTELQIEGHRYFADGQQEKRIEW